MTMNNITHATLVPLIGGATIGQSRAIGKKPEWLASYTPFADNDQHARNHFKDVPYHVIDKGDVPTKQVDIINTVCPCAGLSMLSQKSSGDNATNDWMYETTKFGLSMNPTVLWGENAPGLLGSKGEIVRDKLEQIGNDNGYELYYFPINALEHGLGQNRKRAHYMFTKERPPMSIITRDEVDVRDIIRSVSGHNEQYLDHELSITQGGMPTPSSDVFYRFVKERLPEKNTRFKKSARAMMEKDTRGFWKGELQEFAKGKGLYVGKSTAEEYLDRFSEKVLSGSSTFYKGTVFTCGGGIPPLIGGQNSIAHPDEDRFLNYRELLTLMGLPMDFELINAKRNLNHISQNVPAHAAEDFVRSLIK